MCGPGRQQGAGAQPPPEGNESLMGLGEERARELPETAWLPSKAGLCPSGASPQASSSPFLRLQGLLGQRNSHTFPNPVLCQLFVLTVTAMLSTI